MTPPPFAASAIEPNGVTDEKISSLTAAAPRTAALDFKNPLLLISIILLSFLQEISLRSSWVLIFEEITPFLLINEEKTPSPGSIQVNFLSIKEWI
jgi:hypothetical protein